MSLLGRIQDEHDQTLLEEARRKIDLDRENAKRGSRRKHMVHSAIVKFAESLEAKYTSLIVDDDAPMYFTISDVVLVVDLHRQYDPQALERLTFPSQVLSQYAVSLLGIDTRIGRLERVRVGTLSMLSYESLAAEVVKHTHIDFAAERVNDLLTQERCSNRFP